MENVLYPDRNFILHLSRLLLVSAVLFAAASCGNDKEASAVPTAAIKQGSSVPPRAAMEVSAVALIPKDLPVVKTFVAQTESSRAVDIAARVSGFLDRIAYAEGQFVQEGQVLFQLDQQPFLAQLDAAPGELKQQEAPILDGTSEP
ncbi:MAG: biotin/lipoyl-binding protein [Gammaproteobacteria bacterium]